MDDEPTASMQTDEDDPDEALFVPELEDDDLGDAARPAPYGGVTYLIGGGRSE